MDWLEMTVSHGICVLVKLPHRLRTLEGIAIRQSTIRFEPEHIYAESQVSHVTGLSVHCAQAQELKRSCNNHGRMNVCFLLLFIYF